MAEDLISDSPAHKHTMDVLSVYKHTMDVLSVYTKSKLHNADLFKIDEQTVLLMLEKLDRTKEA